MEPPEPLDLPAFEGDVRREKLKLADGKRLKEGLGPGGEQGLTRAFIGREGFLREHSCADA
ncbi:hypothetical protein MFU01_85860 [Myxococcus fulvus]|uniref:Uncharacterized protein n=1 Tax=Myxococcus fulvus TaxID=33 RepID=A0A511THA0_MYXFU|nr:hypothetical protein MFU01_85860 [Myxococcus fulvus]